MPTRRITYGNYREPWFAALDEMDKALKNEETEGWRTPTNHTEREYAARQARMAVEELRYKLTAYCAEDE